MSDDPGAEQQQATPQRRLSTPLRTLSSPPEMALQAGQDGTAQQASAQQSRTVSGSFSSLSVERHQNSSGSAGFADASGMHHHHLQVLCCLLSVLQPILTRAASFYFAIHSCDIVSMCSVDIAWSRIWCKLKVVLNSIYRAASNIKGSQHIVCWHTLSFLFCMASTAMLIHVFSMFIRCMHFALSTNLPSVMQSCSTAFS